MSPCEMVSELYYGSGAFEVVVTREAMLPIEELEPRRGRILATDCSAWSFQSIEAVSRFFHGFESSCLSGVSVLAVMKGVGDAISA